MRALKDHIKGWIPHAVRRAALKMQHRKLGRDPLADIMRFTAKTARPVVFDVGANIGQTAGRVKMFLPQAEVHSFEPTRSAYAQLVDATRTLRDVHRNNLAVGSTCGEMPFLENDHSHMSSFLEPAETCWGNIISRRPVPVITLDEYCHDQGVSHIDVLKSDTQGFDLEVLKGAKGLMSENRVHMVYLEIIFSNMYENLPTVEELLGYLKQMNFRLVSFYKFHHQHNFAGWSDALFLNPEFEPGASVEARRRERPTVAAL